MLDPQHILKSSEVIFRHPCAQDPWAVPATQALLVEKQRDAGPGAGSCQSTWGAVYCSCRETQSQPQHDGPGTNSCSRKVGDVSVLHLALMEED